MTESREARCCRSKNQNKCIKNVDNGTDKTHQTVVVYDCRIDGKDATERFVDIGDLDINDFLEVVSKEFAIPSNDTFVLTTTDRKELDFDRYEEIKKGNDKETLYLLQSEDQILPSATLERINFLPHYDTLIQSGMYEYYASEGQKALPYAFAELIDNALSATSGNTGVRMIDIRLLFNESLGKPAVVIIDNGCGMTAKQLNNWAVYRLSKFTRASSTLSSDHAEYVRPDPVPRSINSDISFFGVGGKQAVFYIGQSARMITKPVGIPDVHELVISKEEFERKEKNKEDIYAGFIRNRKVGDSSHVTSDEERFLHGIIQEELGKQSFTALVVTGIRQDHIVFLKQDFQLWTRELAHMYHYYIHGIHGNNMKESYRSSDCVSNIDIQISLLEKFPKIPRMVNLRQIAEDMQTLYINASSDTFEFKAYVDPDGIVEGILRYHPFLYDKETYPEDRCAIPASDEDDDGAVHNQARGKRPIFECFWNGRLIPYTTVSEFDWCSPPKKAAPVPMECYSRFSGVLFTNDRFQVSTNKLTFMDLELQLKSKETFFTRIVNGQEQRVTIQKEFNQWLKTCHEKLDKQVNFKGFKGMITRTDVNAKMRFPWATFSSINLACKIFKAGQYVKTTRTVPIFFGSIIRFLLYGHHDGDVYATGGDVELQLEPKALHDQVRTIPISKIDRGALNASIMKSINDDLARLPEELKVSWPEGNPWTQNDVRPAGTPLGPLCVEILNKKKESISRIPSLNPNSSKKTLSIELKIIWHSPPGDVETNFHIATHSPKWAFWFRSMENLNKLGKYTLYLNTILTESNVTTWAGNQLPNYRLDFTITEGSASSFVVAPVNMALCVGEPFNIPLQLLDAYGHPTHPNPDLKPLLECMSLDVHYEAVDTAGSILLIRGVRAKGLVHQSNTHNIKVVLPGLVPDSQTLKISILPGNPFSLNVKQEDPITVENRSSVTFDVEVQDMAGNITARPKLIVCCQLQVTTGSLSVMATDCSNTGAGILVSKEIALKNITGHRMVKATFNIPSQKSVAPVERHLRVVPSTCVSKLEVYNQAVKDSASGITVLRDREKISWVVGDLLQNLCFKLYDEAGREVPLSMERAQKIKVNWTVDISVEELAQGKLPNILVPSLVKDKHFYQVSYKDQLVFVDTSFTIVPLPDEPRHLKATLTETTLRMGEVLPGKLYLELTDQYGNKTDALNAACVDWLTVDADGIVKESLVFTWEESTHSILLTGLRFNPGFPGIRELLFHWKEFEEHVTIRVTAGVPAKLKLVDEPEEVNIKLLQVLNEKRIETPFFVQLVDEWGNPSPDKRVVVSLRPSSPALKISVSSQPVDKDGKYRFVVDRVEGPKGEYSLEFKGSLNKKPIPGPSVKFIIIPDPNKPVKLVVNYKTDSVFPAGGTMPVFSVSALSEEGSAIKNLNPADLSMLMWKGQHTETLCPPKGASVLKSSKPLGDEKVESLHFRDKVIPDRVGTYTIQFVLCLKKSTGLFSQQYVINVVASNPVKLAPDLKPPTPVVTNISDLTSRTLVENMTLNLLDPYNNPAGLTLSGQVLVTIECSNGSSNNAMPLFEGHAKSVQFVLENGKAFIPALSIMENSPGQDGNEYILVFRPSISGILLKGFELPFRFSNGILKTKLCELSRRKDILMQDIEKYKGWFETKNQLITELKNAVCEASNKERSLKLDLQKKDINVSRLSILEIESLTNQKIDDQVKLQRRRVCSIPDPFKGSLDILGKIGHLALVKDDDVATVISWHLLGEMDCVVTTTTAAARRVYEGTQGRQQVMPLDTVFYNNNRNRSLPHIRKGQACFNPIGNPVLALDVLIFLENAESCQKVFGSLLGNTILIDDLDSANHYRLRVVQSNIQCPTILTRQGERIFSTGKFGGLQNKAPTIEKLRGHVFGAPVSKECSILKTQIDLLREYQNAMQKSIQVNEDLQSQLRDIPLPERMRKKEDYKKKVEELKIVEADLASVQMQTPASRAKRFQEGAGNSTRKKRRL
ncbi:hypothetical protein UPYG_G00078180 [Umbra pygmaea]|uniref:SMC hinge domain-containing protein n=1 Tax=Umbra pygmaea TaxID=75934 RepID=A0ABD0XUU0_UMBPY